MNHLRSVPTTLRTAMIAFSVLTPFLSFSGVCAPTVALAANACWGQVRVAPASIGVGETLTISGMHFRCTSPQGGMLPAATIFLYRPGLGFHGFTVHVQKNGTYTRQVTIPAHLRAVSAINGGPNRSVVTRPGRYYLAVRLFDVSLPAPARADAQVRIVSTAPTTAQVRAVMARTVEATHPGTHFALPGTPLTIADGRGTGTLTAVVGTRYPTADAKGQLVFFWHNTTFIGWDSNYEKLSIVHVGSPAPGAFTISYAHYAKKDPLCCPSLQPVVVHSGWSGTMLISDGAPPIGPGFAVRVKLVH